MFRLPWSRKPGPDLSNSYLKRADLRPAELVGASLSKFQLRGADLSWAEMDNADCSDADMYGAKLTHASLLLATFRGTNLMHMVSLYVRYTRETSISYRIPSHVRTYRPST